MFELRANLRAFHGLVVAACLAVLAGCIPEPKTPPTAAPASLVATSGNAQVGLAWAELGGAKGYNVKRSTTDGGPYALLFAASATGYTDTTVTNNTRYYYVVSAFNDGGEGPNSAQVLAIPAVPSVPQAPLDLAAAVGDKQLTLTWALSIGATEYRVKRATTSGGPYTQVAVTTTTTYVDTQLTNGTTYYYVVSAANTLGESPNSPQVSAVPSPPPPTTFGTWINVTPSSIDLTTELCSNFGARTVQADPAHPGHLYTLFDCQGVWKSTNYGATWTGPINTGTNAALVSACSGGITISPTSTAAVPTIYESCIRGNGVGFWRSTDGGVNWTRYTVTPTARQDYNTPVVDPYNQNHLLMSAHEFDSVVESFDGGQTWASVPLNSQMLTAGKTAFVFFVDTGNATSTGKTWLWISEGTGGLVGTWRTTNSGTAWARVDKHEHILGSAQIYQPDSNGVVFVAGEGSDRGRGVLRSSDYGQTWAHVGLDRVETVVIGTSKNLYSMYSAPISQTAVYDPALQVASQPGTGTWVSPPASPGLTQGPGQLAVVNDGTHNILVGAMWNKGVWRYVEP